MLKKRGAEVLSSWCFKARNFVQCLLKGSWHQRGMRKGERIQSVIGYWTGKTLCLKLKYFVPLLFCNCCRLFFYVSSVTGWSAGLFGTLCAQNRCCHTNTRCQYLSDLSCFILKGPSCSAAFKCSHSAKTFNSSPFCVSRTGMSDSTSAVLSGIYIVKPLTWPKVGWVCVGQFIAFFPLCDCREDCDLGRDRILVQTCLVYRMKCRGQISSWGFAHWNLDDIQTTLLILLGFLWSKFLAHETSTLIFHFHINCCVFTPTPWQL